jgi:hypothetical protein
MIPVAEVSPAPDILAADAKVDDKCGDKVIFLPADHEDSGKKGGEAYIVPKPGETYEVDAIGTPRGFVKIPDGCSCSVSCDGKDFEIGCRCLLLPGFNPELRGTDVLGREFPDYRDKYPWVGTEGSPYTRHYEGAIVGAWTVGPPGERWRFR